MRKYDVDKIYKNSVLSADEVSLYSQNYSRLLIRALLIIVLMSYAISAVLLYFYKYTASTADFVNRSVSSGFMSAFGSRYFDLMQFDGVSHVFFYSTTIVTIMSTSLLSLFALSSYFNNVFLKKLSTPICLKPIALTLAFLLLVSASLWAVFVMDVGISENKHIGKRVYFTWIFFPLFSAFGTMFGFYLAVSVTVVFLKFFSGKVTLRWELNPEERNGS